MPVALIRRMVEYRVGQNARKASKAQGRTTERGSATGER
jgi:hypothetical protein